VRAGRVNGRCLDAVDVPFQNQGLAPLVDRTGVKYTFSPSVARIIRNDQDLTTVCTGKPFIAPVPSYLLNALVVYQQFAHEQSIALFF
jgi:hypothetical protein